MKSVETGALAWLMSKTIAVVYTGGTVGMEATGRGLQPTNIDRFSALFRSLPELSDSKLPRFDLHASEPILDSARMKPGDWVRLANVVANLYSGYDGFLFVVGTDTMPYTASALSFFLENLGKPVMITGAQHPLSYKGSDAPGNLIGALRSLAQAEGLFEVAIYFNAKILRGNRSVKISSAEADGIISPRFPIIGGLEDGALNLRRDVLLSEPHRRFELAGTTGGLPQVSLLRIFPGLDVDLLMCALKEPVKGLVLETYGSGTAPDDAEFLGPLERASSRGVVIVNTTQCLRGTVDMDRYKSGYALRDAGVLGGSDMTTSAAYTKLMFLLACGHSTEEVRRLVSVDLRGELTLDRND